MPGLRTRKKALILLRIEAPLGLQLRIVVHEGRGRVPRELLHLLVRHRDAARAVLVLEQDLHDHLLENLVLDLTDFVLRQRRARTLLILERLGDTRLPLRIQDVLAIDLRHRGVRGDRRATDEAGRVGKKEDANEGDEEEQPNPFGRGPHLLQHDLLLRGGMGRAGAAAVGAGTRRSGARRSGRGTGRRTAEAKDGLASNPAAWTHTIKPRQLAGLFY